MRGEEPLCLDMATSCTWNNIKNHRLSGESLEPGWAYDASGSATTDPHDARSLAPIGSYKGFGLGLMVEVFCSLLSDMPLGVDVLPMYESLDQKRYVSHCFVAVDIARFTDVSRFAERMRVIADRIRALPAMDAAAPSMVAGDPQKNHFEERSRRDPDDGCAFCSVSRGFSLFRRGPNPGGRKLEVAVPTLVDIVNFNSDASCLPSEDWLQAMQGGHDSALCQWLDAYIERRRPVVLGIAAVPSQTWSVSIQRASSGSTSIPRSSNHRSTVFP